MAFTRTASGVCIANLHATNDQPPLAIEDVLKAARAAERWAGDSPLIFGGDLNLRPAEDPEVFARLEDEFGLAAADRAAGDRPPAGPRPRGARAADPLAAGAPRAAGRRPCPAPLRPCPDRGQVSHSGVTDGAELR